MSFISFLLYLFCTIIRPQDWVPMFLEMRLVNTLAIITAILLIFESMARKHNPFVRVPQNVLMIGLFLAVLMSQVVHTYFEGLIESFNKFVVILIIFFLSINSVNTERKLKTSIWFMALMVVILVPQGMYQVTHGYGWAGQEITFDPAVPKEVRINWVGIFNDPNDLALLFVMVLGFLLPFIFGRSIFILRILSLTFVGALFYGIYLTNSRGGLLALITTVFFYFVRRTKKFVLGGILGAVLAIGILIVGPSRTALINTQEDSAYNRVELWYEGILMLKANPLFGVGYNMFTDQEPQTTHNSFILAAAELGMVGLFFWVGLIYVSFQGLSLVQKYDQDLAGYAMGLQSSLIGFSVAAFFLSRTYTVLPYLLFAFSGALWSLAKERHPEMEINFTKKDARNTLFLSIVMLAASYIIIRVTV